MPFLAQVKAQPPDVVVLELVVGPTDAVEVIRHLDVIKFKGKVLLISGRDAATLEETRKVGLRRGLAMLPSLRKPFRPSDLQAALASPPETQDPGAGAQKKHAGAHPELRIDLAQALQESWLELWYQPKFDLKSRLICGAEALLRARHPEHGIVAPAQMLPDRSHPILNAVSQWVIRQALTDWSSFADAGLPLKLAVNVPIAVVQAPDFMALVRRLRPHSDPRFPGLIVEITEDDVIRDPRQVHEAGTQLKLYGISLSIDDFGAAHSSLSRLMELPCAEIKIDCHFVSGCASDEVKRTLCQTVIDLAHRFGILTCAEGVEEADDLRCLISLRCDTARGFLFARPIEREAFLKRAMAGAAGSSCARDARNRGRHHGSVIPNTPGSHESPP